MVQNDSVGGSELDLRTSHTFLAVQRNPRLKFAQCEQQLEKGNHACLLSELQGM
jgi:hypothetical protein